ncbi:hypothetical protein [Lentzea sp. NBRC 102530]|uniref:hypothetical protein n=1 Tax=Lentzea sp. NBRC 102530 TaxID=3032201 RepID=UPI0024A55DC5|nr:hypothetical protein [Lentzea sp. NBRC 102530]GLY55183.1 integrase [Lentzea sp. NBRC 102530]
MTEPVLEGELVDERVQLPALVDDRTLGVDEQLSAAAWDRIARSTPANTLRAYDRLLLGKARRPDGKHGAAAAPWPHLAWVPWCEVSGRRSGVGTEAATQQTLAEWVAELADAGIGTATIEQGIAAVRRLHRECGHSGQPDTTLALQVLRGELYERTSKQKRRVAPVTLPILISMLEQERFGTTRRPHPTIAERDACMFTLGIAGMLRRSELAALGHEHAEVSDEGLVLWIASSKTDRMSRGAEVVIPRGKNPATDPVRQYEVWRDRLGDATGPLLRAVGKAGRVGGALTPDGRDVARRIKVAVAAAGMNPALYAGHSLRAGGATIAHLGGASLLEIMKQGRWRRVEQVLEYIRLLERFTHNAAGKMGL